MGENETCSWDDSKRALNLKKHLYDFPDIQVVFDGRFAFSREDTRHDYGEKRFNMLVDLKGRIINITFNPRGGKYHLISVRPASLEERRIYHAKQAKA